MHRINAFFCLLVATSLAKADSPGPLPNPLQEYPPSCVSYPLPTPANTDPVWTLDVDVPTRNSDAQIVGSEVVRFFFWRTPCADGTAALLGVEDRSQQTTGTSPVPDFPPIMISQGSATLVDVRAAAEPNTRASFIAAGIPVADFQYFVLENGAVNGSPVLFDYSQALTVTVSGVPSGSVAIPAYNPNLYADSSLPLQISGYQTGNYADPTAGGQGVQVEVAEAGQGQRAIVLAWYTYDATGTAYWLFNSENFAPGARSVSLPLGYFSGGAFVAGNGVPALWGTVSVSFPDCDHMTLSYQSAAGLPNGTPQGSGTRTFTRATSINGVSCD